MTESFLLESLGEGICESRVTLIFAFRGRLAQMILLSIILPCLQNAGL